MFTTGVTHGEAGDIVVGEVGEIATSVEAEAGIDTCDVAGVDKSFVADSELDEYNEAGNILPLTIAFLFNG